MPFMCTSSFCKDGGGGGKGRPVKIITDNSAETIVFGNNEINNNSMPFKSKLSPDCKRDGKG